MKFLGTGRLRTVILTLLALGIIGVLGAVFFVYSGIYNVSALGQHTQPMYALIDDSLRASIRLRASALEPPPDTKTDWRNDGLLLYQAHCVQCHGAPGVAPDHFALGMTPKPTATMEMARSRSKQELFWVIKHGIKMSGMPAWEYRLTDQQMWNLVAFIRESRHLSVADYQRLAEQAQPHEPAPPQSFDRAGAGNSAVAKGHAATHQYGCVTCHVIPGVTGATSHVGPSLEGMADRAFIAGVLPNTPENMIRWLQHPQEIDPLTAMPPLGVTREDAENMTAFLATLKADREVLP